MKRETGVCACVGVLVWWTEYGEIRREETEREETAINSTH